MEVTHRYAFDGWAVLVGTRQPSHRPGTLVNMARSPGPPETVLWSIRSWPLQLGDFGYLAFLHGISGLQKWIFLANQVKITWTFMTFSFRSHLHPTLLTEAVTSTPRLKGGSHCLLLSMDQVSNDLQPALNNSFTNESQSLRTGEGPFNSKRVQRWMSGVWQRPLRWKTAWTVQGSESGEVGSVRGGCRRNLPWKRSGE